MGYPLQEIKGTHSGECVIIANGPSTVRRLLSDVEKERGRALKYPLTVHDPELLTYPLNKIPVPVIGVNQAWKLMDLDYLVVAEQGHYRISPETLDRYHKERKLFTIGSTWDSGEFPCPGYNLKILGVRPNLSPEDLRVAIWPEDIASQGITICFGACGTVSYSALQIACYLGFTEITWIGLDLRDRKFTGEASGKLRDQREMFRAVAPVLESRGVKVRVVGLDSAADCWERVNWPW